ncbi:DUF4270 domain-containing protein [Flavobacterium pallidum]|uniref:DUF4270 domain-containing protein n=1 Tax=Flavobacterium pallidum TaxID=2172098 RepID=A0A2S1SG61_9FLAO|nr:DUF4270 domain-containing protein [Flavobacterium pallidum]AWI25327.1 DUF4270 domain-containing protein [Flavobacterium pallidum]
MNYKTVRSFFLFISITAFFASCDKEYNDIGTDVIGEDHFLVDKYTGASVVAFDKSTGAVQSNNLPVNPLGIYDNPTFGVTKAGFVTQAEIDISNLNNAIGNNPLVDSVYISIPYFSSRTAITSGVSTYELDSIYGSGKMKLKIYENGYYLNDLDPATGFEDAQRFFNDDPNIESYKRGAAGDGTSIPNGKQLNDLLVSEGNPTDFADDHFTFSNKEIITKTKNDNNEDVISRSAPAMRMKLNKDFFQKKILDAPAAKLANNASFRDYFRGLYFKMEDDDSGDGTTMAMMDFSKGTINIAYKEDKIIRNKANTADSLTRPAKKYVINLKGNTISLQQHNETADYNAALSTTNTTVGDEKLYLKGGQGSIAVIDLFGPGELEALRDKKWLVNEANLTFYIDRASMKSEEGSGVAKPIEPERLYLYDLTNKRPLYDYATDGTTYSTKPKFAKVIHDGIIQREEVKGRGVKYRIRITNYMRNLLKHNIADPSKDSTNVRIGLAVTESINIISNARLKNPTTLPLPFTNTSTTFDRLPAASVMHPLGTVLWGSAPTVADDKRLKLEIYYTEETNSN